MSEHSSTLTLIERAHEALLTGYAAESASVRHRAAQLAAMRGAAAVVAARDQWARREHRGRRSPSGPVSLWDLLTRLTPELSEWARHFSLVTSRLALVESGRVQVSVREADDLLRDAEAFLVRAELVIGVPARLDPTPRLAPARLDPVPHLASHPSPPSPQLSSALSPARIA